MALGSPEHSGRVRGVGAYVNPSSYFNEPVRHGKHVNEIIKETVKQLIEEERAKGHALAKEMVAVERGYWVDKMTQLEDKIERFSEARGSPILPNLLTPPTHLSDKGSCSAAKVPDENNVEPKACNDKNLTLKNKAKCLNFTQPSIALQNLQPMPSSLKVLCRFAERTLKVAGETINFIMEAEVFGLPRSTHILYEDILQFGEMLEISGTCIMIYMRYLHEVLKTSNKLSMIGFVDPAVIGALGCGDVSQRSRVLATWFSSAHPDQIFLIPYNSRNHWMLTIVNVDKETIYFMDPLNRIIIDEEWKQVVNTAIKVLNVKRNRKGRKTPQWIILMGTPNQPTNTECGYFVMRYMKKIIEDKNLEFASKWSKTNDCTYTQNQIDEVRSEWADYVMTDYV